MTVSPMARFRPDPPDPDLQVCAVVRVGGRVRRGDDREGEGGTAVGVAEQGRQMRG